METIWILFKATLMIVLAFIAVINYFLTNTAYRDCNNDELIYRGFMTVISILVIMLLSA